MAKILVLLLIICTVNAKSIKVSNLKVFDWSNCGDNDAIEINSLKIPDPIMLPGLLTIDVDVNATQGIENGTSISFEISKYIQGTPELLPCIDNLGSCTYDLCAVLESVFGDSSTACPDVFIEQNIPCHCPLAAGEYKVVDLEFEINVTPPEVITDGVYKLHFSIQSDIELLCVDIDLTIVVEIIQEFHWASCGQEDPIIVSNLSITPDPIVLPGNASLSLAILSSVNITSPTQLAIIMERQIEDASWVQFPCIDNVGSCVFPDFCQILQNIFGLPDQPCPNDIQCRCPIESGEYYIDELTIPLNVDPADIIDGNYHIQISMTNDFGQLLCVDVYATLLVVS